MNLGGCRFVGLAVDVGESHAVTHRAAHLTLIRVPMGLSALKVHPTDSIPEPRLSAPRAHAPKARIFLSILLRYPLRALSLGRNWGAFGSYSTCISLNGCAKGLDTTEYYRDVKFRIESVATTDVWKIHA